MENHVGGSEATPEPLVKFGGRSRVALVAEMAGRRCPIVEAEGGHPGRACGAVVNRANCSPPPVRSVRRGGFAAAGGFSPRTAS